MNATGSHRTHVAETLHLSVRQYYGNEPLSIDEVCTVLGISREVLARAIDEEIVRPSDADERNGFTHQAVETLERSMRLHNDLGVNWSGIAVIEQLLARIEDLETRLHRRQFREIRDADADVGPATN